MTSASVLHKTPHRISVLCSAYHRAHSLSWMPVEQPLLQKDYSYSNQSHWVHLCTIHKLLVNNHGCVKTGPAKQCAVSGAALSLPSPLKEDASNRQNRQAPPFPASEPDGTQKSCSSSAYCIFPINCYSGDQPWQSSLYLRTQNFPAAWHVREKANFCHQIYSSSY